MNISKILNAAKGFVQVHSPEFYIGAGIALSAVTVFIVGKKSPVAQERIFTLEQQEKREATLKEKVGIYIKECWPALVTFAGSTFFICSGHRVQYKRTIAMGAAYTLAQDSLQNFTRHVVDEIGDRKVLSIKEDMQNEQAAEAAPFDSGVILYTNLGDTLCYDAINGRPFYCSIEAIRKAESEVNRRLPHDMFVSLDEFYDEINLPHCKFGDELGWDVSNGGAKITFSSLLLPPKDTPTLVMNSDNICARWHMYS